MNSENVSVHIIAGFLGAGKTTFINKLFADGVDARSTVLIENELGETSIDDQLLQAGDLEVRTLTSGCVCCSLRGDLADTIELVVSKFAPKTIIIEPTGIACPNELIRICSNDLWHLPLTVESVVTIVNAQNADELIDLDIGVFSVQLEQARLVVLSRTQFLEPEEVEHARAIIWEQVGWHVPIIDAAWDDLDALEVLAVAQEAFANGDGAGTGGTREHEGDCDGKDDGDGGVADEHGSDHGGGVEHARGTDSSSEHDCEHAHEHEHGADRGSDHDCGHMHGHEPMHAHGHEHEHGHGHDRDHVRHIGGMESAVVHPERSFGQADLQDLRELLESKRAGQVLRAKGFVASADGGMLHVEYVYGDMQSSPVDYDGKPKLVIIGRNLANIEALLSV